MFEFVDANLDAAAARMTLLSAIIAFDRFGYGVLGHYQVGDQVRNQVRGLHVADEFIRGDSVADVFVRECCRLKFVASKITPALRGSSGGALSHGFASVLEGDEAVRSRCFAGGSISCEMLRLGYITEKSQAAPRFSSRIGQTACS